MKTFSAGFQGTVTDECLAYACAQLEGAQSIVVPFTGSGKNVAALSRKGRTIHSWDTQEATNLLVEALRNPWDIKLNKPMGAKGWASSDYPFDGLDEGTARLINYIAQRGGSHDKAALVKTIINSTLMGRLGAWANSNEGYEHFWIKFVRARDKLQEWASRPGIIYHTKGDYFQGEPPGTCDGLYLDPPKIIGRTDVYSGKAYKSLNSILEQKEVQQPKWVAEGYLEQIERVIRSTEWKRALVFYSSGLVPTLKTLLEEPILRDYASIKDFDHSNRLDYVITIDR